MENNLYTFLDDRSIFVGILKKKIHFLDEVGGEGTKRAGKISVFSLFFLAPSTKRPSGRIEEKMLKKNELPKSHEGVIICWFSKPLNGELS